MDVQENQVVLSRSFPGDSANADQLKGEIDPELKHLDETVNNLTRDVHRKDGSSASPVPAPIKKATRRPPCGFGPFLRLRNSLPLPPSTDHGQSGEGEEEDG
jgi:hypothetical protein